jgi:hypothetical protein
VFDSLPLWVFFFFFLLIFESRRIDV